MSNTAQLDNLIQRFKNDKVETKFKSTVNKHQELPTKLYYEKN